MKRQSLNIILLTVLTTAMLGCKLQIEVPPGGHIEDDRGQLICDARQICRIDIVDLFFDETYIAVPGPGYTFHGWKKRHRGLYGGHKGESVRIYTSDFEGNDTLMALLNSDIEYYLEPDFARNHHLGN